MECAAPSQDAAYSQGRAPTGLLHSALRWLHLMACVRTQPPEDAAWVQPQVRREELPWGRNPGQGLVRKGREQHSHLAALCCVSHSPQPALLRISTVLGMEKPCLLFGKPHKNQKWTHGATLTTGTLVHPRMGMAGFGGYLEICLPHYKRNC